MKKPILTIAVVLSAIFASPVLANYGIQAKTSNCTANQISQDLACTPGAVLTTNISIICKVGYTKTVRDVSTATKKKVFSEYGIPYSQHANYEVDHLISLELGGSNDISNLWPENSKITNGSLTKDKFENYLHRKVCSGKMSIQEAQKEIPTNWLTSYQQELTNTSKPKTPTLPPTTITPPPQNNTSVPVGATGMCNDGTYTYAINHQGACSKHKGVKLWY